MVIRKRLARLLHEVIPMRRVFICTVVLLMSSVLARAQNSGTIKVNQPNKPVQQITASIAGKSSGLIKKNYLLSSEIIKVNDSIQVIMYEFHLNQASVRTNFTVQSNQLNDEVKRYIDTLRAGQIIRFKNILCRDKNGLTFRVSDIQFEIVN